MAKVELSAQSFYYYQHQPIALELDPSRLVVSSTRSPESTVRAALAPLGLQVSSVEALPQAANHWLLRLGGGPTSRALAQAAVARLKANREFQFVGNAYKTVDGGEEVLVLNRLIVHFKSGVTQTQIDSLNAALGTRVMRPPRPDSGFAEFWLSYPADSASDALAVAALLDRHPLVAWAEPDKISQRRLTYAPSDAYYPLQFHLKNSITRNGIPVDINIEPAWDLTRGENNVRVAILDDGADWNHDDVISSWAGAAAYDAFYGLVPPEESPMEPFGNDTHGTSIMGMIFAEHNGIGVAGIAPNTTLRIARIFRHSYPVFLGEVPNTEVASDAQIADAITWAWNYTQSDVLNNSWGGGSPSTAITNAIVNATTQGRGGKGTVVVFSAGNTSNRSLGLIGPVAYPATLSTATSVIAVSAVDRNGNLTNYSPEGSGITLVAPSGYYTGSCVGEVVTTDRWGSSGCNDGPNGDMNYTTTFSGTSAAAPQVAGVAALLLSREPWLTAAQVRDRLATSADPWGPSTQFGVGKLNAGVAVNPVRVSISGPTFISTAGTYTWTASPAGGAGGYTFQWSYRNAGSGTWTGLGSGQTQSRFISASTPNFTIRVVVTSAGRTASATQSVVNEMNSGGCNPFC